MLASPNRPLRHLLQWLLMGTRGGFNRGRILIHLKEDPQNANQLGNAMEVDYRTVRHHLEILEKNKLITAMGERYGKMYFISMELEENWHYFEEIWKRIGKTANKGDEE